MSNKPIVYGIKGSPTVKSVLLTLKELNLDYEFRVVRPLRGENQQLEYLRKNPAHTIPTLEDDGHFIGDSHAIIAYLVGKYAADDTLYPKDLHKRAVVDHRLHFDNSLFISCVKQVFGPIFAELRNDVPTEKLLEMEAGFAVLEGFIGDNVYLAGPNMTIADLSCISTVTNMTLFKPVDAEKFPKLTAWLKRMKSLPYFDEVVLDESSSRLVSFLQKTLSKL